MLEPRDYSYLTVEVRDGVAFATRNRPENKNRYTSSEEAEYPRFLREASQHPDVRAIVVTGAGDEWFCAGVDLPSRHADIEYDAYVGSGRDPSMPAYPSSEVPEGALVRALLGDADTMQPLRTPKPIITALNGSIAGGVLTSVLLTDVVIAERHVRLRDVHVNAGLVVRNGRVAVADEHRHPARQALAAHRRLARCGGSGAHRSGHRGGRHRVIARARARSTRIISPRSGPRRSGSRSAPSTTG